MRAGDAASGEENGACACAQAARTEQPIGLLDAVHARPGAQPEHSERVLGLLHLAADLAEGSRTRAPSAAHTVDPLV